MKLKNLKDRPDSEGLWWASKDGENFKPVIVHMIGKNFTYVDKLTTCNFTTWLSDEERTRQIFEAGFKAGDPAFLGEDSVFLIAFEQFIKE